MSKFYFIFLLLPLFYLVRKTVTFRAVIRHGNHTQVFYFLSNVTKFQILNPTITSIDHFEWLNETDFYIEYTERLSQVPAIKNHAQAYYKVRHDVDGSHKLISKHLTCFFTRYLCLSTHSTLRINKLTTSKAGYEEEISYSCPWPLLNFCFNEVAFQRMSITSKLNKIFSNTEKNPKYIS